MFNMPLLVYGAAQTNTVDIKLFQEDVQLSMPKNVSSYWFRIPEGTAIGEGCYLDLGLNLSGTLIDKRSSISFAVNGIMLETKGIYDVTKDFKGRWRVFVPQDMLRTGELNEITLTTTQRSIEGDCADIDNPSNWVCLDKDSYFHIVVNKYGELYLGNLYTSFYDNLKDKYSMQNEYILPQSPDKSILEGMLKIASAIGANAKDKPVLKNKVSTDTPLDSSIRNKLYIGTSDKWESIAAFQLPKTLSASEGFLSAQNNSVLITGKDKIGFDKAVRFFSSRAYLDQILEKQLTVTSEIKDSSIKRSLPNETGFYKFENFGYDAVNLKGAFHQSATFTFRQPSGIKSGKESYVNVKFHHSKALVSDHSLLTVYLNNIACDSVKLSSSNADGGNLKVKLPEDVLNSEKIELRTEIYNYIGKVDCSKDFSDTAWTVIDKASEVYFEPSGEGVQLTLRDFPFFNTFSADSSNDLTICIPADYKTKELSLMSLLSTRLGQSSGSVFNYSVCTEAADITKDNKNNDMIFLGAFDNVWFPKEVSSRLGIVSDKGSFTINPSLTISSETLKGKVIFQVIRSPWNFHKKIYVLTYDKSAAFYAAEFLSDKRLISKLVNQVAIVDTKGRVANYDFGDDVSVKDNKMPLTPERIKYLVEKKTGVSVWFLGIAFLIFLIAILILGKVIRDKNKFKKAAEDMRNTNIDLDAEYSDEEEDHSDDEM